MWFFSFYRFYLSLASGACVYFFFVRNAWVWIGVTLFVRSAWYSIEYALRRVIVNRDFHTHIAAFRQEFGPYGIRLANKAADDFRLRRSLAEVFTANRKALEKTVGQLEVMDTLFTAGMRPDGDEYLLHDLKLKYGKRRLERQGT